MQLRPATLTLLASVYFAAFCNFSFWKAISTGASTTAMERGIYFACLFVLIVCLHYILLALLINRWTAKPLLATLVLVTAAATWFMDQYGVFLDPSMIRNVLATDWHETRELLSLPMLLHISLSAGIPLFVLSRVKIRRDSLREGWWIRPASILLAIVVAIAATAPISQRLVPQMREHPEVRHLLTPGNYLVSLARIAAQSPRRITGTRIPVAADARRHPAEKPLLLVIVVGETVRAENWGLNGYARQTTPELAALGVVNYPDVTACGTSTAVSLPCMFSAQGRRHYDEEAIHHSDSLLHVLARTGIRVVWMDNQSGCKGVCRDLEYLTPSATNSPDACGADGCLDAALLDGLGGLLANKFGDLAVLLHPMGNHGPAYHRRYPDAFRHYVPTCDTGDLGSCTNAQIINTYDNAILYTDHILASTIALLRRQAESHRVAMIYVSDHGESLGENGFYLHGLPYAIAPTMQTRVPMFLWLANGKDFGVDSDCMRATAINPISHDNLFHSVLGLAGITTHTYDATLDITATCQHTQTPS